MKTRLFTCITLSCLLSVCTIQASDQAGTLAVTPDSEDGLMIFQFPGMPDLSIKPWIWRTTSEMIPDLPPNWAGPKLDDAFTKGEQLELAFEFLPERFLEIELAPTVSGTTASILQTWKVVDDQPVPFGMLMRIDIPVSVAPELLVSTSKGELFSLKELAGMSNTEMTVAAQAKVHFSKCHGVQSLTLANYGGKTLRVEFENLTEVQSYFANVNGEVVLQLQVFYVPANGEPRDPMTSGSYTWSVVVE